jgi:hypothetical protein
MPYSTAKSAKDTKKIGFRVFRVFRGFSAVPPRPVPRGGIAGFSGHDSPVFVRLSIFVIFFFPDSAFFLDANHSRGDY